MLTPEQVRVRVAQGISQARVIVRDLTGGGDHFEIKVISAAFEAKSMVDRQRMVYKALGDVMDSGAIHALTMTTVTPEEEEEK